MQKKFILSYLSIFIFLLLFMSLSHPITERVRGEAIAFLAPLWDGLDRFKHWLKFSKVSFSEAQFEHKSGMKLSTQEELQRLQLENQLLLNQLSYAQQLINEKQQLEQKMQEIATQEPISITKDYYESYLKRLQQEIELNIQALPAKVIFRSFDSWNSSLWINVGESHNAKYATQIVAKNSPVLSGNAIVGVIDYVGRFQSRVRLITDPRLTPSVRAARGGEQESLMGESIEMMTKLMNRSSRLSLSQEDRQTLLQLLTTVKDHLQPMKKSWYLAKGELLGNHASIGRQSSPVLHGIGFNYDFADEEGEGRDLRTGKLLNHPNSPSVSILKPYDILVTTGMDGVFPPGLKVAIVTKVNMLKEGDYFYELEAQPLAGALQDLSVVFVIPPIGYDSNVQALEKR